MSEYQFSLFNGPITNIFPSENITLERLFELISSGLYTEKTERIRQASNKQVRNKFKSQLPYVTFNGTFSKRNAESLITYSGYICLDFDALSNTNELFTEIIKDKYVAFCFISPSGNGIKVVLKINSKDIPLAWELTAEYFKSNYDLDADPSGKDIARACFIYDSTPYYNCNSEVFDIQKEKIKAHPKLNKGSNSELERAKMVVSRIIQANKDLTDDYNVWLKLGFALAIFKEEGRILFHQISEVGLKYDYKAVDEKFDECLKTSKFTSAGFFFSAAKKSGICVTKNIKLEGKSKECITNEIHSNDIVTYNLQDFTISIKSGNSEVIVAEGFLIYIQYQTTDENNRNTWILEIKKPDDEPIYLEINHDDFFEPKTLERLIGALRLSMAINYVQLQKLRTFLFNYTHFPNAIKITRFGLHNETELYFFSNCAISKSGEILKPDSFGIIHYNNIHLSLPQVNKGQTSPFTYVDNTVTFSEWYKLFSTAQTEKMTFITTSFLLFSLFRDNGIVANNFSPILFVSGPAGTAKSTLIIHILYLFGVDGQAMGINLKGRNTEPAFAAKIEQQSNGFVFCDEYKPNHPLTSPMQGSYDNKSYSKMNVNSLNSHLDTINLVPKSSLALTSNFFPNLPEDEPFFSRLVLLFNNNRDRTLEQTKAFNELKLMQEAGITNIIREIWQYRDLIAKEFKATYLKLVTAFEKYFKKFEIGNPRYIYNLAQILTVPLILSFHGKIAMCEAVDEDDLINEFILRAEKSILHSDEMVKEKSALKEFFDIIQDLYERNQISELVHFKFEQNEIILNLQKLHLTFSNEFKRTNRFEIQPPSIQTIQEELLKFLNIPSENAHQKVFRKVRFNNEFDHSKIDFARNCININYLDLQSRFGIDFRLK